MGLAYRCKVQRGTFRLAMEDLRASIQWFETRAATYQADAIIFSDLNHGYFNPRYPVEYKTTTLKIAGLYAENLKLEKSKVAALPVKLDKMLSHFFPVDEIKPNAVRGQWNGETETLAFQAGGKGTRTDPKEISRPFTYPLSGNTIVVDLGKTKETYFMQRDLRVIYKFYTQGRFAGNKQWYEKQK